MNNLETNHVHWPNCLEHSCRCPQKGLWTYWSQVGWSSKLMELGSLSNAEAITARQRCDSCHKLTCLSHKGRCHVPSGVTLYCSWQMAASDLWTPLRIRSAVSPLLIIFRLLVSSFQPHHCGPWNESVYSGMDWLSTSLFCIPPQSIHFSKAIWSQKSGIPRKESFLLGYF